MSTGSPAHAGIDAPTAPEELPAAFAEAFNSGEPAVVERLFEPDAVFVTEPGNAVSGEARRAAVADFLALGVPITLTPRHVYTAGDLALIVGEYLIEGTAADGSAVHSAGVATDVARRGGDGRWRYVIDSPPGITP